MRAGDSRVALTDSEILESIDNAIRAWSDPDTASSANGIQSLSVAGRSYTRTNLLDLIKVREKYAARVANANRGPIRLGNAAVSS